MTVNSSPACQSGVVVSFGRIVLHAPSIERLTGTLPILKILPAWSPSGQNHHAGQRGDNEGLFIVGFHGFMFPLFFNRSSLIVTDDFEWF